jgi:peptidoglycan/LPS O-acetylase OafA/YrhL
MQTEARKRSFVYQPELDALRFFAYFAVFLHHVLSARVIDFAEKHSPPVHMLLSSSIVSGAFGVSIFLTLSSYLITRLLLREVSQTGSLDLRSFYVRRALRIWPRYFFFLALNAIPLVQHYIGTPQHGFLVSSLFFSGNWCLYFLGVTFSPTILLWTISVEEQFYLVWPLLARSGSRSLIRAISWTAIAVSQITVLWLHHAGHVTDWTISYNTLTQLQFFGLGALLALSAEKRQRPLAGWLRALMLGGGVLLLLSAARFDPRAELTFSMPWAYNAEYLLALGGVLLVVRAFQGAPARLFPGWILYLGKISYGLYVFSLFSLAAFHKLEPIPGGDLPLRWIVAVFAVNVGLAVAAVLRLKSHFERIRTRVPAKAIRGRRPPQGTLVLEWQTTNYD